MAQLAANAWSALGKATCHLLEPICGTMLSTCASLKWTNASKVESPLHQVAQKYFPDTFCKLLLWTCDAIMSKLCPRQLIEREISGREAVD